MVAASDISYQETGKGLEARQRGMRAAQRHSRVVRFLRTAFPVCCGLIVAGYALSVLSRTGIDTGLPELNIGRITATDLKMSNPKYSGFGEDGSSYNFTAKTASQDLLNPGVVTLDEISGTLLQADKTKTDVSAKTGIYNTKSEVLDLDNGIRVVSESGMTVSLPRAKVQTKESLLTSEDPVQVSFPAGTINAKGLTLRQKVKEVTFRSNVVAKLKPAAAESTAVPKPEKPAKDVSLFGQSDAPLDITSRRLDIKDQHKVAIFSGNVRAVQGDSVMETPQLTVGYANDGQGDGGSAAAGAGPLSAASGKIKDIFAKGPVVMTRGDADRVTSDQAQFDAQNETGVLTGNVVMRSGADRLATGDRVDLDQRNERVVLSGRTVLVKQGKNELRGERLFVDQKAAITRLSAPSKGRINAHLVQSGKAKPKSGNAGAGGAGAAPAKGGLLAGQFKTNPDAPVEIEANRLDVNDKAKSATFSGAVVAKQGDFVMKTPVMVATYTGSAGIADIAATGAQANAPAAQISRIQAKQKVAVSTKDGRTVDGDWADVDMKANTITVGGDVKLTQGQTVVRGTRLTINMTTGESTIDTAPEGNAGTGGFVQKKDDGGVRVIQGGRPSATFFPLELKKSQ